MINRKISVTEVLSVEPEVKKDRTKSYWTCITYVDVCIKSQRNVWYRVYNVIILVCLKQRVLKNSFLKSSKHRFSRTRPEDISGWKIHKENNDRFRKYNAIQIHTFLFVTIPDPFKDFRTEVMAKTTGWSCDLVLDYAVLVALVNDGFECMFVLNVHVKMHLRFGSKAVYRQFLKDIEGKHRQCGDEHLFDTNTQNVTYRRDNN